MSFADSFTDIEFSQYKHVSHMDKLTALANGVDVFPVTVELDLVDYCNHNCAWCVDPVHKHNSLESAFASKLLAELKALGIEGIVFKGGGEPTLHESFSDLIREARTLDFEVGIVTNGSRLTDLHEEIVLNANYLRVSIDGPNAESHRRIHRSNDFELIVKGLERVVETRAKLQQRHPIIGISFAMDYSTIDLVAEAITLADRLAVDYVLLRPPFLEEVGRRNSMTIPQKKRVISTFDAYGRMYHGRLKILVDYWIADSEASAFSARDASPRRGKCMPEGTNGIEHLTRRCLASPLLAVVTAEKKVYPCCNLRFVEEWNVGKIDYSNGDDFESIWNSDTRKKVMQRVHRVECLGLCTHPMSKYNEIIEYLKSCRYHKGFV